MTGTNPHTLLPTHHYTCTALSPNAAKHVILGLFPLVIPLDRQDRQDPQDQLFGV